MTEVTEAMLRAGSLRYMKQPPTQEQRDRAARSELYEHGDAWLVWVNEGDLHNLSALSAIPIPAPTGEVERLAKAASNLCVGAVGYYTARNGKRVGIQDDSGEKCWIVTDDDLRDLERAVAALAALTDHTTKDDDVPAGWPIRRMSRQEIIDAGWTDHTTKDDLTEQGERS